MLSNGGLQRFRPVQGISQIHPWHYAVIEGESMISKATQYKLYAGTKKDDYTGWEHVDVDPEQADTLDFWSLNLGNGYFLDRITKVTHGRLFKKVVKMNSVRRDRTIEDPDGDYKDLDFHVLFDVKITVAEDSIKFDGKQNSFVLLSREPIDWEAFAHEAPKFSEESLDDNWSSFYR